MPRLGYVTQVVQESMRLYPPAWVIEREALAEDRLGGYRIPAGATVAVSPYVLHRHPEFWTNPEGFDPDRFAPGERRGPLAVRLSAFRGRAAGVHRQRLRRSWRR